MSKSFCATPKSTVGYTARENPPPPQRPRWPSLLPLRRRQPRSSRPQRSRPRPPRTPPQTQIADGGPASRELGGAASRPPFVFSFLSSLCFFCYVSMPPWLILLPFVFLIFNAKLSIETYVLSRNHPGANRSPHVVRQG